MCDKLAGGRVIFRAADGRRREEVRRLATELYDAGASIGAAEEARKTREDGFLYVIAHPKLRGVKIGRAFDAESRLNGYQTGCPDRAYYLAHVSPYFEDCVAHEKAVHAAFAAVRLQGEWFDVPVAIAAHTIDQQSPFRAIAASE